MCKQTLGAYFQTATAVDLNGDGMDDILMIYPNGIIQFFVNNAAKDGINYPTVGNYTNEVPGTGDDAFRDPLAPWMTEVCTLQKCPFSSISLSGSTTCDPPPHYPTHCS